MPSGRRGALVALLLASLAVTACGGAFAKKYEYEEELTLAIDGSATVSVNASIASLVALHGAALDPDPRSRPDRERIRALFSGPDAVVETPTFFRRNGRRFVHVRVEVPSLTALRRLAPFAWSSYRFARSGDALEFRQMVGGSPRASSAALGWTGQEVVAFRMHVPSRIVFENATSDVQRGNILAWEQPLADRLAGAPLQLEVDMEPESILHSTLLLFAASVVAAGAVFALAIWWVVRRGRSELASESPN
jgi:hypothetical protein